LYYDRHPVNIGEVSTGVARGKVLLINDDPFILTIIIDEQLLDRAGNRQTNG
jgi:hypothetical protein